MTETKHNLIERNKMKKFTVVTALLAGLSFNTFATDEPSKPIDVCFALSELAESVMRARQLNTPIATVFKIANGSKSMIILAKDAYKRPLYSSDEYKLDAINSFGSDVFLECANTIDMDGM